MRFRILRRMRRPWTLVVGMIVIVLIVAACGGDDDPTATPRPIATAPSQVTATTAPTATPRPTPTSAPTATPPGPQPTRGGTLNTRNIFDWTNFDTWHAFSGFSSMLTNTKTRRYKDAADGLEPVPEILGEFGITLDRSLGRKYSSHRDAQGLGLGLD
ncbi:MAG: hypothetical protein IIC82_09870 [Chloroflexi bacterium]|nr:hypothetical protein [Chloroflexota bacterium]